MVLLSATASSFLRRFAAGNVGKISMVSARYSHDAHGDHEHEEDPEYIRIEHCPNREQIGYGVDGEKTYYDFVDFPVPSVRYKQDTPEVLSLREKEKGDWKNLTIAEKKELYRNSFRLTFVEIEAPTGRWKSYLGWVAFWWSVGLWYFYIIYHFKNDGRVRPSLTYEARQAQLQRLIALKANPIDGLASYWDYEKDDWKDTWNKKWNATK